MQLQLFGDPAVHLAHIGSAADKYKRCDAFPHVQRSVSIRSTCICTGFFNFYELLQYAIQSMENAADGFVKRKGAKRFVVHPFQGKVKGTVRVHSVYQVFEPACMDHQAPSSVNLNVVKNTRT